MLNVGFASADITPDAGMDMPGGFRRRAAKGAADKLLATACVVFDGNATVALVGVDALFVSKAHVAEARRLIAADTRIPPSHVLVNANHTHTGGPTSDCLGSAENPAYAKRLVQGIATAVGDAWRRLHPAEAGVGTGREETIAYNRRFLMRDGREITHPGKPGTARHAEIVQVAGPVDPEVGVLAFRDPKGRPVGAVVCYGCHSTVYGGDKFHPDYAGFLRKHLAARFGEGFATVFLLGVCGDITQVDNLSTGREGGPEYSEMMGVKLAAETARVMTRAAWLKDAPITAAVETPGLAIRGDPDVDRERPAFGLGSGAGIEDVYAEERRLVAEERRRTPVITAEIQALRVGPLGIAANGAELFCEYGLRIKRCSPFAATWVPTLSNEWIGYVPTAQAFVGGGYEPRTARSSKLAVDAGQKIVESSLAALAKVAPAK